MHHFISLHFFVRSVSLTQPFKMWLVWFSSRHPEIRAESWTSWVDKRPFGARSLWSRWTWSNPWSSQVFVRNRHFPIQKRYIDENVPIPGPSKGFSGTLYHLFVYLAPLGGYIDVCVHWWVSAALQPNQNHSCAKLPRFMMCIFLQRPRWNFPLFSWHVPCEMTCGIYPDMIWHLQPLNNTDFRIAEIFHFTRHGGACHALSSFRPSTACLHG